MAEGELNCEKCLRYSSEGATNHHQFCPLIADNPQKALGDYERGWQNYCGDGALRFNGPIKRGDISATDANNPYFMMGYNVAFYCDDDSEDFRELVDLHLNEFVIKK